MYATDYTRPTTRLVQRCLTLTECLNCRSSYIYCQQNGISYHTKNHVNVTMRLHKNMKKAQVVKVKQFLSE